MYSTHTDLLYEPSHSQDSTYHSFCYTSCGALAGMRSSSKGPQWRINHTVIRHSNKLSCLTHSKFRVLYYITLDVFNGSTWYREREREMFYLTTHSTHFIYAYMVSDIWLRTILIVRKETRCRHIGYSYRLITRVLLYASSHRQDNTYHGLCYTSRGALAGMINSSMGPPHEGSNWRPIEPSLKYSPGFQNLRHYLGFLEVLEVPEKQYWSLLMKIKYFNIPGGPWKTVLVLINEN